MVHYGFAEDNTLGAPLLTPKQVLAGNTSATRWTLPWPNPRIKEFATQKWTLDDIFLSRPIDHKPFQRKRDASIDSHVPCMTPTTSVLQTWCRLPSLRHGAGDQMCSCRPYEVSSRLKVIATLASSTNAKKLVNQVLYWKHGMVLRWCCTPCQVWLWLCTSQI